MRRRKAMPPTPGSRSISDAFCPPRGYRRLCNTRYMPPNIKFIVIFALAFLSASPPALPESAPTARHPSMPEVLAAASPADWRPLDPENTLYVELPGGRVVLEL